MIYAWFSCFWSSLSYFFACIFGFMESEGNEGEKDDLESFMLDSFSEMESQAKGVKVRINEYILGFVFVPNRMKYNHTRL